MRTILFLIFLALLPLEIFAAENDDLNLIPNLSTDFKTTKSDNVHIFLEDDVSTSPWWQNRTSLDFRLNQKIYNLNLIVSDRLNETQDNTLAVGSDSPKNISNTSNDIREVYLSRDFGPNNLLQVGRINIRNGIAFGFNPTDFFKSRSLVSQASIDPSVVRQNRIGTFGVYYQHILEKGNWSFFLAPKLASEAPLQQSAPNSFATGFDRTNTANRGLLTYAPDIGNLSPQIHFYADDGINSRQLLGVDLSYQLGRQIIVYGEWSGGKSYTLSVQSNNFGISTGAFPAGTPVVPSSDLNSTFRNDFVIGASWTSDSKITANLEYINHDGGLTHDQWLSVATNNSLLWYLRSYANDQQTLSGSREVFLRISKPDTFFTDLELSAFAFINVDDLSSIAQLSADYHWSDSWTVSGYLSYLFGSMQSEFGGLSYSERFTLQAIWYF